MAITPKPTDIRVEVFAGAIAAGKSQAEAYKEMHPVARNWTDESVYPKASEWATVDKVLIRVEALKKESARRNQTTLQMIDTMHKQAFAMAMKQKQPSAMTQAAMNLAKTNGLIQDVSKVSLTATVTDATNLSDEELEAIAAGRG